MSQLDGGPVSSEHPETEPTLEAPRTVDQRGEASSAENSRTAAPGAPLPRRRRKPAHLAPNDDETAAETPTAEKSTAASAGDANADADADADDASTSPLAKLRFRLNAGKIIGWFFAILGAILLASSLWVQNTFGYISFHQLLANMPTAGGGEGGNGDPEMIRSYFLEAVGLPLLILVALAIFYRVALRQIVKRKPRAWMAHSHALVSTAVSAALFAAGVSSISTTVSLPLYVRGMFTDETLANYYQSPQILSTPDEKKNLVLIYLESMDDAFSREDIMGENLLRDLDAATDGWASVPQLTDNPYYGFTMGGIVDSQCGTPPKPADGMVITEAAPEAGNKISEGDEFFMPSAVCLGDVLKADGYTNYYMGGAAAWFAHKGKFLQTHGFDTVIGRDDWVADGETELSGWGLSDRRNFTIAKERIKELHDDGEPFTFSTITLDNHAPLYDFGYCPNTSGSVASSTLRCQSEIVADFINYMDEEGILENTVVVVMADHSMFMASESSDYKRKMSFTELYQVPLYNRIWSPDGVEFSREVGINANMYPTILELLGYELKDGRAGVGVSFQTPATMVADQKTLVPLSYEEIMLAFNSRSTELYQALWKAPEEGEVDPLELNLNEARGDGEPGSEAQDAGNGEDQENG
ncbi:MAG: LTA synthase family protein [Ancrocorticia sp.]